MKGIKDKRRQRFEEERVAADARMRADPAAFLWELYARWAGPDRLSALERDSEQWPADQVSYLHVAQPEDAAAEPLIIAAVKKELPALYARAKESRDGVPSVSVVLLASSGLRASQLGKMMYDGKPVGKLFSKHISKQEQRDWLLQHAKKKAAPTAVGTARRLHVLCEEGSLSLACTTVVLVDMTRNSKLQTLLDMTATKDEFFDFMYTHMRPLMKTQQAKILLYCSE